jgi:polyhydroxybutyrate depolymerase
MLRLGAEERSYRLYVPTSVSSTEPVALVVALHGGGGNAANLERKIQMDAIADQEGFIVVYPNGSGQLGRVLLTWNAGNCCGYALDESIDDVAFLRALVGHLAKQYPIDSQRVYATGMSNGAMMSYRLACEASDVFAAVAPVAGALNMDVCDPELPVSVLSIHGTEDQHVRFEGGVPAVSVDRHERVDRSVADAVSFWADRDGCNPQPQAIQTGEVRHATYTGCLPGFSVELLAIEAGGHAWPGATKFSPRGDAPSQALDASQAIWEFFAVHPRP